MASTLSELGGSEMTIDTNRSPLICDTSPTSAATINTNKSPAGVGMLNKTGCAEVKVLIFEEVKRSGSKTDFTNLLRVCQDWNTVASPLLWSQILVTNDNILPLLRSLALARNEITGRIRNLSVFVRPIAERSVRPVSYGARPILGLPSDELIHQPSESGLTQLLLPAFLSSDTYGIEMDYPLDKNSEWGLLLIALRKLCAIMKDHMSSLTYMSFRVACWIDQKDRPWAWYTDLPLPRDLLVTLLRSIPLSCTSIEIDDCGYSQESCKNQSPDHLCAVISWILPRMQYAQIKVTDLCSRIAGSIDTNFIAPKLKELHINICPTSNWVLAFQDQRDGHVAENITGLCGGLSVLGDDNKLREKILVETLHEAFEGGSFPKLSTLKLLNLHRPDPFQQDSYYTLVNVIDKTTHLIPRSYVGTGDDNAPDEMAIALAPGQELYYQGWDEDKDIECIINDGWFTTTENLRFPSSVNDSRLIKINLLEHTTPETALFGYGEDESGSDPDFEGLGGGFQYITREVCDHNVKFYLGLLRQFRPEVVNGFDWEIKRSD